VIWDLLLLVAITVVPWIELRGSIPVGVAMGYHPLLVLALAVIANCLAIFPGFLALDLLYDRWLSGIPWIRRQVERVRVKGGSYLERYELIGLTLFVGVPLPGTGAYAGTLLAWLTGLERRRAALAIAAGVIVAGVAVTLVATGVVAALRRLF